MPENSGTDFFDIVGALGSLANLFGGIYGGIKGSQRAKWAQGLSTDVLNKLNATMGAGMDIFNAYSPGVAQAGQGTINQMIAQLIGTQEYPGLTSNLQDWLGQDRNNIAGLFSTNKQWGTDTSSAMQRLLADLGVNAGNTGQIASQIFAGGGWTPQYEQQFGQLADFLGQTSLGNRGQVAGDVGNELFTTRGNTQFTQMMQELAQQMGGAGGFTPTLNAAGPAILDLLGRGGGTSGQDTLRTIGSSILDKGGLTDTGAVGEGVALEGLLNGGGTDITRLLQQLGVNMAGKDNLLSPFEAASFAANDAMATAKAKSEQAYNRAVNRGGGPGANVANGMQNGAMSDFADEIAATRAKALSDTLLSQQGLSLERQKLGTDMATAGGSQENQRLSVLSNLLASLEGVAANRSSAGGNLLSEAEQLNNQRLLGGLNFIPALQKAATDNVSTFGNLGLGGANLANSNLNTANNIWSQLAGLNLGGLNAFTNTMNNQNQFALGGGSLANAFTGTQGNLFDRIFANEMQGGQMALNQNIGTSNAQNQTSGNLLSLLNSFSSLFNNNMGSMTNLAGIGSGLWGDALRSMPGIVGAMSGAFTQNPWASLSNLSPSGGN